MQDVVIAGIGMTKQGRLPDSISMLASQAAAEAMADAVVDPRSLGLVVVGNAAGGLLADQECIRGQSWLRDLALDGVPVVNVENACAAGSTALHVAHLAVAGGTSPALVVGVEKMWLKSRSNTLATIEQCLPAAERDDRRRAGERASGSAFMAMNACWALQHMEDYGTTVEQFAAATVKARRFGALNPWAQQRAPIALDEVLSATLVAPPLTRPMCSSFTDGAAAVVLSAGHHVGQPRVTASVLRSGDGTMEYHQRLSETAELTWKGADISPSDVDIVELHDATSAEELWALEALGFFEPGEAGPATVAGETSIGGHGVVVNPSGGLVARGHAFGATGLCQIVELALQLRGSAGSRQVEGAEIGVTVNTGGIVSGDAGAVAIHVLQRA